MSPLFAFSRAHVGRRAPCRQRRRSSPRRRALRAIAIGGLADGEDAARFVADEVAHPLELAGLSLPPRISQDARRREALAATSSVASTFVPFESLIHCTPSRSRTSTMRCGRPANVPKAICTSTSFDAGGARGEPRGERVLDVRRPLQLQRSARDAALLPSRRSTSSSPSRYASAASTVRRREAPDDAARVARRLRGARRRSRWRCRSAPDCGRCGTSPRRTRRTSGSDPCDRA